MSTVVAFFSAVEAGDRETVSTYIRRNPEKWKKDVNRYKQTCLHLARDAEMAGFLVSAGADMEARATVGRTPFLSAVGKGNREVMDVLIKNGCNVYAKDIEGDTSLHLACRSRNQVEIADYLLSVGADIEAVNNEKRTPFLEATFWGKAPVTMFLIEKRCNIYARDKNDRGAIDIADSRNHVALKEELVKIFRERQASFSSERSSVVKDMGETVSHSGPKQPFFEDTEEESLDASQRLVCELQDDAFLAEKESLINALHAFQQLVRDLQRRLDKAEEERDAACAENTALLKEKDRILLEAKEKMAQVQEACEQSAEAFRDRVSERCNQLEQERDALHLVSEEAQRNLSKYEEVLKISSDDIEMSDVKLGGGSYGDVRVGRWHGCHVAVKTFYDFLRIDIYLRRLEQEISICRHVHHPNVVALLGVITQDEMPLRIVSELLEASLSDIIAASYGHLILREQIDIAVGCSSGLGYLHALDILHGDIRSTNVVVTSLMEAKICDLGAARFAVSSSLSAGPMSPDYVAPERRELGQHNTKMADVYSLGVTFIELMTGEHPAARKRMAQCASVRHPVIRQLSRGMVNYNSAIRPLAKECLFQLEAIQKCDEEYIRCPLKRMVKGMMHGEGKVHLVNERWR
ncbi:uncharacterized protein [Oscarella lobularis]|uniref:uncharacterized protein isoform X4 n=1 Tax=Oscarella lobularis TaxID=121494 RepID=UPI0033130D1A